MALNTTLEHPADIARYLTNAVGRNKVKEIKFGYRLDNDEPAIKFKIKLRFPYNLFARKSVSRRVEEEMAHCRLADHLPPRLLFHVQ